VTAITACTVLYTRSAGVAYFSAGALACSITVKMLKRVLRQARPVQTTDRKQKQTYGYVAGARVMCASSTPPLSRMPSTHSATITFYGTYIPLACAWLPLHPSLPDNSLFRPLATLLAVPWALAVAGSRIRLGHHTVPQVAVGCAYGFTFAWGWFSLWTHGFNDLGRIAENHVRTYIG
jgi:dolichyldiphosphatase